MKRQIFPSFVALAALAVLAACVRATSPAADDSFACDKLHAVAAELASLHQYGDDGSNLLATLAADGASPAEMARYRALAAQLKGFPVLAGEGGREQGAQRALEQMDLTC